MKKLILLLLLTLSMQVYAEDFTYEGINYTILDEETKTCETKAGEFDLIGYVISAGNSFSGALIIPSVAYCNSIPYTVVKIGDGSFFENNITSLSLPNTIQIVGTYSFSFNPIVDVQFADSYVDLRFENSAFVGTEFENINLPLGTTYIGRQAFSITKLKSLILPPTVEVIAEYAFDQNFELKEVVIPQSVREIGNGAFGNSGIEVLTINMDSVPKMVGIGGPFSYYDDYMWWGDIVLKTINFGSNVKFIAESAFVETTTINKVTFTNTKAASIAGVFDNENLREVEIIEGEEGFPILPGYINLEKVILPKNVKIIPENAFSNCIVKEPINIPTTVESIGANAFKNVPMDEIEFSDKLKTIGEGAFADCGLKEISFPTSLNTIGNEAFRNNNFTALTIPSTIIKLGENVFVGNPLETLDIDYKEIGNGWFQGVKTLRTVKFGDSVESIGEGAFADCGLKEINFPTSLHTIGNEAFRNNNFTALTIPSTITKLGENVFVGNPLETLDIDYKEIGNGWFQGMKTLRTVKFGDSVESIGDRAFANTMIATIDLPESLKSIGREAFTSTGLTSINVPESVTFIGDMAFSWCSSLTSFTLPETITHINDQLFMGCSNLKDVKLHNKIKSIGDWAFSFCDITNFDIPESLTTIGENAFAYNKLSFINLKKNLTEVGDNAFSDNPIEKVYVGTSASVEGTFPTDNLIEAIFEEDAVTIPSFSGAQNMKDVTLPPLMEALPANAFKDCIALDKVVFPDGLKSIGDEAFMNCTSLTKLNIPKSALSFGKGAFRNCANLRSMIIPDGMETVPDNLMDGCTALSEILIPNTVTSIGEYAFSGCSALKNIDLGTGVYNIGNYAFSDCPNITDIHSMAQNPPFAYQYTFPAESYTKATVTVQEQSLTRYNQENPWYRFNNYLTVTGAVSLSHYQVDMAGNEVFQLGVYGATGDIEWTSSNPTVAYANKCGLIVAMGITGSTTITAHVDGEEINCRVTVSAQKRETRAKVRAYAKTDETEAVNPVEIYIEGVSGNPPMVNVRLVPIGAATVIDWTTSDDSMATVENGIVTVHVEGDVEFGAETENGLEEICDVNTIDLSGEAGIKDIPTSSDYINATNDVYDLMGRRVIINATPEQIRALNAGIYIVNGKKMMVK